MQKNSLKLIGCASGMAGVDPISGQGPTVLQNSTCLKTLMQNKPSIVWDKTFSPDLQLALIPALEQLYTQLAQYVSSCLKRKEKICIIGGDHSCAIGAWSGAYDAYHLQGEIGLIWIDAHMDGHTPETSESGRIHGMPVAVLLGHGYQALTTILHQQAKIKPHNICLIGVRSYEKGEARFLQQLNVKIYFMEEVQQRGFSTVLEEAIHHVTKHTVAYGLTLDIDSIDPKDAPGVDVPEPNGIAAADIRDGLNRVAKDPRLIATEIVEFDPTRDLQDKTQQLVVSLIDIIANPQ